MAKIQINSTIKLVQKRLAQLDKAQLDSLYMAADHIKGELVESGTMPFKDGTMQNTSTFVDDSKLQNGKVAITSTTPYARRLYYHPEYNFAKNKNANAGGKWFEPYLDGKEITRAYKEFLKRQGDL